MIIQILILLTLGFIAFITLKSNQNTRLNWAMFYSTLCVAAVLPLVNFGCVNFGFWSYPSTTLDFQMPFDLYFIWVIIWGVIPLYFLKGKYFLLVITSIFWFDIIFMPQLEKLGLLQLNKHWIFGELLTIGMVFAPAYLWGTISFENKWIKLRSFFQVLVMGSIFIIDFPLILFGYGLIENLSFDWNPFLFQVLLIIIFPALVAVYDLSTKGKGTPFPFDPTRKLVTTGIYAYIKNPIQWSFTLMFIPLAIHHETYYFLLGILCSLAYTIGVSDVQEYDDMKERFGKEWEEYSKNVHKWRFSWTPKYIPKGTIYFDSDCNNCNQFQEWFLKSKAFNLEIKSASEAKKQSFCSHICRSQWSRIQKC